MAEQTNPSGTPGNLPGLYRHPDTGAELVVTEHPKWGSAMADGVVAQGYKYVGPAPKETAQAATPATEVEAEPKTAAELRKELEEAEKRELYEKNFNKLNRADLERLAEHEGVKLTEAHDTNDKVRAAITEAREAKEGDKA